MIKASRRGFITGLVSLVAAPAIVRAGSLMPVKQMLILPLPLTVTTGDLLVCVMHCGDGKEVGPPAGFIEIERARDYGPFTWTRSAGAFSVSFRTA